MPVRQQNFSSSATVGGWMRQRTSKGYLRCSAPSVHGGAGGYGTRISSSSVFGHSGSVATGGELTTGGKFTMQNLNDRLASYLEKVRFLDDRNKELRLNIDEFCMKKTYVTKDYKSYFSTIEDLKAEVPLTFHMTTETLQEQILTCTTEVQTYHSEISKLKRTYQALEISRQSLCTEVSRGRAVIIKQVTEQVEEQKPLIEKRVKTIVEELVDGKVVSSSVDTQVAYKCIVDVN
uniref:Keratin 99 n=1 Tax=Fundulus heteroclitus TaxID=8078 RepID=A0A3Q2Q6Y7_FUNHE